MADVALSPRLFTARADAIREVLRRHKVLSHYQATNDARRYRYAVFSAGIQNGGPCSHAEAQSRRENLIIQDLLELDDTHG
jgi:hypothetical protein